jgi:hypothetical protein
MRKFEFMKGSIMKSIVSAAILVVALLGFTGQHLATAQTAGSSASGSIKYTIEDGTTRTLDFRVITNSDGSTSGSMVFGGEAVIPDQDVDGTGDKSFNGTLANLEVDADFDGFVVNNNRAVMSGTITGSTLSDYIGQRVLLIVEDNGTGIDDGRAPDQFSWGVYKPANEGWIPADAELKSDDGWGMTWWATDAEVRDDKGYQITRNWVRNCQSFPLSSYDFVDIVGGVGDIQVKP